MAKKKNNVFKTSLADSGSRMLVVVACIFAVVALVVAWAVLRIAEPATPGSQITKAPNRVESTTAGGEDARMTELLIEQDRRLAAQAVQTGGSMAATLTALSQTDYEPIPVPRVPEPAEVQEPVPVLAPIEPANTTEPAPEQARQQQQQNTTRRRQTRNEVNQAVVSEMQAIMSAMALTGGGTQVFKVAATRTDAQAPPGRHNDSGEAPEAAQAAPAASEPPLIRASTVLYAVMEMTADSDVPGPIMARVVAGPFKGARLLGSFERSDDNLRITLNSMSRPEYGTVDIDAIAVNPNNASVGLATYVNNHYLQRFGGLILGGFVEGFGAAVAQSGQTSVVSPFGSVTTTNDGYSTEEQLLIAAGAGAAAAGSEIKELANTEITVRVAAGTPIGVLFLSDVEQPE